MEPKKTLLVYYSRTGVTHTVASEIGAALMCDVEQIRDIRSRKGLFGWLRSGFEASTRKLPAIAPLTKDAGDYDLVVVGTPVWSSTMASPVRTWLDQQKGKLTNTVAFFCTMDGADSGHTIPDMGTYSDCDVLASLKLQTQEVRSGRHREKLAGFIAALNR